MTSTGAVLLCVGLLLEPIANCVECTAHGTGARSEHIACCIHCVVEDACLLASTLRTALGAGALGSLASCLLRRRLLRCSLTATALRCSLTSALLCGLASALLCSLASALLCCLTNGLLRGLATTLHCALASALLRGLTTTLCRTLTCCALASTLLGGGLTTTLCCALASRALTSRGLTRTRCCSLARALFASCRLASARGARLLCCLLRTLFRTFCHRFPPKLQRSHSAPVCGAVNYYAHEHDKLLHQLASVLSCNVLVAMRFEAM